MDCRRAFAALLIAFAGLAASGPVSPIREAAWTAPGGRLRALTSEPQECLTLPQDRITRERVASGRLLFRTPLLLGGQAARAGLSCASCHRNGRGNPDFLFPGLSGAAGSADVTSSFMSHSRGDGQVNPKPIPDLGRDAPKIDRDPAKSALEAFLRGLVVEEFDGPPPSARSLGALAAYVRAVRPGACSGPDSHPISLASQVGEVVVGLAVARSEATGEDLTDMRLIIGGVRDRIGQIAARYGPLPKRQAALAKLDRALAKIQDVADNDPDQLPTALDRWQTRFAAEFQNLTRDEPRSWFNVEVLAKSL